MSFFGSRSSGRGYAWGGFGFGLFGSRCAITSKWLPACMAS
ncbi:hypothetical protein C731_3014 [Mycolicibacterium hassiacum DSM 44199]|uniref:Uncharacterized protein n=1 Tax=Mycolicibacterium hassiacum (strain DSM 44199 / CIP 105218 / JCM 12690 / 3849) TaxID=1122247 RepID=K5BJF2_MYCHD|nr:hypothetical protein C731_3014 [Mycolicibacterium hassiacum DSM 44199]